MTLEEKLAISKQQQKKIEKGITLANGANGISNYAPISSTITGSVDDIDNAVFGEVNNDLLSTRYDAREEMKRIEERKERGNNVDYSHSKIPKSILNSIIKNPLDMPSTDPKMDAFTQKLQEKLPEGINRSYAIQNVLEGKDKAKSIEEKPHTSSIDYEMIKMIIENAVEKKLSELKGTLLTEGKENDSHSLRAMKIGNKFLFLDNDNNIFECQMKYIGKNKKRKQ